MVYEPLYHVQGIATLNCLVVILAKRNQQDLVIILVQGIATLNCLVVILAKRNQQDLVIILDYFK